MIFEIAVKCEQCKQKQSSIMVEYYYLQLGLALQHYCTKLSFNPTCICCAKVEGHGPSKTGHTCTYWLLLEGWELSLMLFSLELTI